MNTADLRRADLNLLTVFATLMHERSVTRAGQKLFLSQSATSSALARLRELFQDELFIRAGRELEPTARAVELWENLNPALLSISSALGTAMPFDPANDTREFRIGMPDDVAMYLLPRLMAQLRSEAPRCTLVVHHLNFRSAAAMLTSGEISTAIGYLDDLPATAKVRALHHNGWKILRADDTPGTLTLEEYAARPHVLVTPKGDLTGVVDRALAEVGMTRRVVLGLPNFTLLPAVLTGTDMLATVSSYAARDLAAVGIGLRVEEPPLTLPRPGDRIAWRATADSDPAEIWLRRRIIEVFDRL